MRLVLRKLGVLHRALTSASLNTFGINTVVMFYKTPDYRPMCFFHVTGRRIGNNTHHSVFVAPVLVYLSCPCIILTAIHLMGAM